MIVDDERLIRQGLKNVIPWEQLGFTVTAEAGRAKTALEAARTCEPDILITDIRMPGMSGLELIAQLQAECPRLRSVIISGYNDFDYAVKAMKLRVEDYILKPIDPETIKKVFTRIRVEMDEERKHEFREKNSHYAYTEFEMIHRLHTELSGNGIVQQRYFAGSHKYRVVIFRRLDYRYDRNSAGDQGVTFGGEFLEFLSACYFISTEGLLTVLLPENNNVESFIAGAERSLGSRAEQCRIAVFMEAVGIEKIIDAYLAASPLLYRRDTVRVNYCRSAHPGGESENLTGLRKTIIDRLEAGLSINNTLEKIISHACNLPWNPMVEYVHMLLETSRYFHVSDFQPSAELRSGLPEDPTQLPAETGDTEALNALLSAVFRRDMENLAGRIRERSASMAELLTGKVKLEIEENYGDPELTLSYLAEKFKVSYGYLSAAFSKNSSQGFASYLRKVRMEKARDLLLRRNLKIYEVAVLAGYSNTRYFSDAFKKQYGISPGAYIARMGGNQDEQ